MSALDNLLSMLGIGSAEASPLVFGAPDYPYKNVDKAVMMLARSAPLDEVWQQTQLYPYYANGHMQLLGEIPDTDARLKVKRRAVPNANHTRYDIVEDMLPSGDYKLSEVLSHPALFRNYPELANLPVKARNFASLSEFPELGSVKGSRVAGRTHSTIEDEHGKEKLKTILSNLFGAANTYNTKSVDINYTNNKGALTSLLHELTHVNQIDNNYHELDPLAKYYDRMPEIQAYVTQNRLDYPLNRLRMESPASTIAAREIDNMGFSPIPDDKYRGSHFRYMLQKFQDYNTRKDAIKYTNLGKRAARYGFW